MADVLRTVFGVFTKRCRDMGDTTHAEVVAIGGDVGISGGVAVTGDVGISGFDAPADSPVTGQVKVAETGTAVPFSATEVLLPGKSVMVWSNSANAAAAAVGGSGVTNTVDGTGNGVVIPAGETRLVFAEDLADVYLNGTAGDWISYAAA